MRIMIFRTFAHTKIWEGMESYCHYSYKILDTIQRWEPNITDISLEDAQFGLGIYTSEYFTYITKSGKSAFDGTIEETHPSLLRLQPTPNNTDSFMEYQNGNLNCYFKFDRKFAVIDRTNSVFNFISIIT